MAALVIVSGAPASGKTMLARRIAHALGLPMISRDAIKEALFDTLGWRDRAWSRELGVGSTRVMFQLLEEALGAGVDCLAEGTFRPATTAADFGAFLAATAPRTVQVHCVADNAVLVERFSARAAAGDRHPGHCDELDEFRRDLRRDAFTPLPIDGPTLLVDSSRPADLDMTAVITQVAHLMTADPHPTGRGAARGDAVTP